jgi:long-chain fatty acid transport protein
MRRSCLVLLLALAARGAGAAGFALYDQSARGIGMGGAFTAQVSDPSALFHNAAGIAFQQRRLSLGGSVFTLSTDFTGANPYPGAGREERLDIAVPVPVGYYVQPVSDRLVLGLGVFAPFGLKTEWDDPDFSGRFVSRLAKLNAIAINPTAAWRVSDRFAVGGGVDVRVTSVTLERDVPFPVPTGAVLDVATATLASDTAVDVGFNVGVLVRPTDALSFGAAYRHRVNVDFTGQADFEVKPTGSAPVDAIVRAVLPAQSVPLRTAIAFPAIASVGAAWSSSGWTVEADVNWYQWSRFEQLELDFEGRDDLDQTIREDYQDSLQYRLRERTRAGLGRARRLLLRREPGARRVRVAPPARSQPARARDRRRLDLGTDPRGRRPRLRDRARPLDRGRQPRRLRRHVSQHRPRAVGRGGLRVLAGCATSIRTG